eukprot:TRINITY_DN8977_c0_g1_i1.p1 TRINITY_DN8977_c0_g1~~TRINITY_DN8977_c0_g1_i1.p1  ORF type:complete len:647 (+),score=120.23 TRINITY_DN8977_c0_g1_i1:759-2699(+)
MANEEVCSICLDVLKNGKSIFTTGCNHSFHFTCIRQSYLFANDMCPMCRRSFNADTAPVLNQDAPQPTTPISQPPRARFDVMSVAIPHEDEVQTAAAVDPQAPLLEGIDLRVECTPEFPASPFDQERQLCSLISIKAPRWESNTSPATGTNRVPLDLVAVVDRSNSMTGSKLLLLKQTLQFVVRQLSDNDRFSIVSFDRFAYVVTGLRRMNQAGKAATNEAIFGSEKLQPGKGTNIIRGLQLGVRIMLSRRTRNPVSAVLLLTDGQDRNSLTRIDALIRQASSGQTGIFTPPDGKVVFQPEVPAANTMPFPIFTFGFGSDHDARVLAKIAERAQGTFCFIERVETVGQAFANCLGGLLSVVAQDITLRLQAAFGCTIVSFLSARNATITDGHTALVQLGDMYLDEARDVLLIVLLPKLPFAQDLPMEVLSCDVTYTHPTSRQVHRSCGALKVQRPQVIGTELLPAMVVDVQRNRLLTSDAMQQAVAEADAERFPEARTILQRAIAAVKESRSNADPACRDFVRDLEECCKRFSGRRSYETLGSAFARSASIMHREQRSVTLTLSNVNFEDRRVAVHDVVSPYQTMSGRFMMEQIDAIRRGQALHGGGDSHSTTHGSQATVDSSLLQPHDAHDRTHPRLSPDSDRSS